MDGKNGQARESQKKAKEEKKLKKEEKKKLQDQKNGYIDVHQKALDDLVNVNSLFTLAVFVGLAYANPDQRSLENRPECNPDHDLAKSLVVFEVNSFACFLLSSLIAKSMKVLLNIRNVSKEAQERDHRFLPDKLCKRLLLSDPWERISLALSVFSSFAGIVLMTLSMINVIQIRVGKLSCGSEQAFKAVASLSVIVFTSLLFYVPSMVYAVVITASACKDIDNQSNQNVA